jgi:hypothetical protein
MRLVWGLQSWILAMGLNGQTFIESPKRWAENTQPIKYRDRSLRHGGVWSLQRPSPKSKPLAMNSHILSTRTAIVWSPKGQAQCPKEEGASHFILYPQQPLESSSQDLVIFWFFLKKKKINNLSTIVCVFDFVRPKPPSRVRRLGQKVLPCRHFEKATTFGLWPRMWKVEKPNYGFLGGNRQPLDLRP